MELTDFLHADTNSCKLKSVVGIKECGQPGKGTLKLTLSEEWTDGITNFLHFNTYSQKLKAHQNFFGWAWSKMCVASLLMGL